MTRLLLRRRSAAILIVLLLSACMHQVRPNAVSKLDDSAYTFLTITQAALNATRTELTSGALPATLMPPFNKAVDVYLQARAVWLSYRERKSTDRELSDVIILMQAAMLELNKTIGRQP